MITIVKADSSKAKEIASFIAHENRITSKHCGYCGEDEHEILHSLNEDLSDVPFHESFALAYENDRLVGVIGFDADLESENIEIWGPFIRNSENEQMNTQLWEFLLQLIPHTIKAVHFFISTENTNLREFLINNDFIDQESKHTVLSISKKLLTTNHSGMNIKELTEHDISDFKYLHDSHFHSTYYNSQQIIERINEFHKVFVYKTEDEVVGYIYVEIQLQFGEGSIEFFAVDEKHRGKGIGVQLLTYAVTWMLSNPHLKHIDLCVNNENKLAIHLYKKIGFAIQKELFHIKKHFSAETHSRK
ncbi:GNAT family N-acetyltransferase [Fictibacillus nanhaiensis]|uniref:GNAT family N-acetyltransferase n=1 Tax=Fictibacillus nanhaiensis TaxID=742169 RepID=UPI002E1AF696|nr:GNAT family N-acetyltransferase [Fictibacillus nanhaiensis]